MGPHLHHAYLHPLQPESSCPVVVLVLVVVVGGCFFFLLFSFPLPLSLCFLLSSFFLVSLFSCLFFLFSLLSSLFDFSLVSFSCFLFPVSSVFFLCCLSLSFFLILQGHPSIGDGLDCPG